MSEHDAAALARAVWDAMAAGEWDTAGAMVHDDFVQEWPQSGERIEGREAALAIYRNFPGGMPRVRVRRVIGLGDVAVIEMELTYGDGSHYHGVSVMEFLGGLLARETDYFGEPFHAPQWRAQWVTRMDPHA